MNKWLSVVALIVSLAAIAMSVGTYQEADARAAAAVRRREQELVRQYTPELERICEEFGIEAPSSPATIEELVAPLLELVSGLDDAGDAMQDDSLEQE